MTCQEYTSALTDHMEGRTSPFTNIGIVVHSMICSGCRRYKQQFRTVVRLANDGTPDAELQQVRGEEELVAAFAQARGDES